MQLNEHHVETLGVHGISDTQALVRLIEDPRLIDVMGVSAAKVMRLYVSRRSATPWTHAFAGDSITEGYYAGFDAGTWVTYLGSMLHTQFYPTNFSEGFIPAWHVAAGLAQRYTTTGSPTTNILYGWGNRAMRLHSGETASITVTTTAPIAVYSKDSGLGTISVSVDGGAATTAATAGTKGSGFQLTLGTFTQAPHTIVVTAVSGDVIFDGIYAQNGPDNGPRIWNGGHAGASAQTAAADLTWVSALSQMSPGVIELAYGVNDFQFSGLPAEAFEINLTTIVNAVMAASPFSAYVMNVMWPPFGTSDTTWQPWADATRRVARSAGWIVHDLWSAIGTPFGAGTYWQDTVHPNIYGSIGIAEQKFRWYTGAEPNNQFVNDQWRQVTGGVGYQNGWTDFGTYDNVAYRLTSDGRSVMFSGVAKSGTINATVFTLPTAYWPKTQKLWTAYDSTAVGVWDFSLDTTGNVKCITGGNNAAIGFHNVLIPIDR